MDGLIDGKMRVNILSLGEFRMAKPLNVWHRESGGRLSPSQSLCFRLTGLLTSPQTSALLVPSNLGSPCDGLLLMTPVSDHPI